MKNVPALWGALICMILLTGCHPATGHDTAATEEESALPPADQSLIQGLYYAGVGKAGKTFYLQPATFVPVDQHGDLLSENDPVFAYRMRGIRYVEAHQELMSTERFAEAFGNLERYVILEVLPERPNVLEAQQKIYRRMAANGMARALYEQVGPSKVVNIPDGVEINIRDPFITSKGSVAGAPDSIISFHCCGGNLVITELGKPYSQYTNAHRALLAQDPAYRADYLEILVPFEQAVQALDPYNPEDIVRCEEQITTDWRTALQQPIHNHQSVRQRIEDAARQSTRVAQNRR